MVSASMTHRDDGIFQNPTMFDPSRFEKSPPPFSYIPFGGGSRICPDKTLAMFYFPWRYKRFVEDTTSVKSMNGVFIRFLVQF
nr:cytochrome P450 716B1-like [Tanacetum cinerariifolium]